MSLPTPIKSDFSWPIRVYWEDTDAGGIVFYANYLKFFERARTEWLRSRGIEQSALKASSGGMFVVSETQVRFLHSARLDDELIVTACPVETGRASMTISQQAWRVKSDTKVLLCEGSIRIGWVNSHTYKPARIPSTILETLK
ncbi:MAG: tol-pal system-associated acyl-CoA thioesterase [Rhodoferax sp.]|mgnify:FL=1|jgi:acyl-CoA thioester hydrolase|nr:tol-pal system-associated acyl-CoA thioesterase [Rhodoferax sp.]MBP9060015.1 tol-pal system-associated acyl-CoA thioesterase [Rhodoferax sp.]MBP9683163.1 tol-pal system-associated acyl-CoA thioesterase [Rhodoferax sp.]